MYKQRIIDAMNLLARDTRTIFIGQNVIYSGAIAIHESLQGIPGERRIELPVAEEMQMGMSIGLALAGYIPVSIYPRMDFLVLALNQLVNHLDKIKEMSAGRFKPKVIIRTCVGAKEPLNPGPQHCQDHTAAIEKLLSIIEVIKLNQAEDIIPAYKRALDSDRSTVLVEFAARLR